MGGRVLDLQGGYRATDEFLAKSGFSVLSMDTNRKRIAQARERTRSVQAPVGHVCMSMRELNAFRDNSFNAIVADLGTLNHVQNLRPVFKQFSRLLRDNGTLFLPMMNRFSVAETLAYIRRGRLKDAWRRWVTAGEGVPFVSQEALVWFHPLRELKRLAKGRFTIQHVMGINILTPTPSFREQYDKHPHIISFAHGIERAIDSYPFISLLGGYFVVVLEKFE